MQIQNIRNFAKSTKYKIYKFLLTKHVSYDSLNAKWETCFIYFTMKYSFYRNNMNGSEN